MRFLLYNIRVLYKFHDEVSCNKGKTYKPIWIDISVICQFYTGMMYS